MSYRSRDFEVKCAKVHSIHLNVELLYEIRHARDARNLQLWISATGIYRQEVCEVISEWVNGEMLMRLAEEHYLDMVCSMLNLDEGDK